MTPSGKRFWFFISYSHGDRWHASKVQSGIERFVIPAALRTGLEMADPLPARLGPVFRDRDVLAAAHDLSAEIRGALESSERLIVVCSRAAAQSKWVAREVATFLELHGAGRVCCVFVGGSGEGDDVLPAPLREVDRTSLGLMVDMGSGGDGVRQALTRIIAWAGGISHERFARAVQRRTAKRVAFGGVASLAVAAGFVVLAARAEQTRRAAAIEAMKAEQTTSYLVSVLEEFLPSRGHGIPPEALLPLLDAAAASDRLAPLTEEPAALIRVRRLLAEAYADLGKREMASELLAANVELALGTFGEDSGEAAEAREAADTLKFTVDGKDE